MVTDLYRQIEELKRVNCLLAQDNMHLKADIEMLTKEKT
jgi:cell division protein FtsB